MNIEDLFNVNMIKLDLDVKDRNDVIEKLSDVLCEEGKLSNRQLYVNDVLEREKECTTGVGRSVAIPHGKSNGVKETSVVFARLKNEVDWNSLDGQPVKMVFLLAIKKEDASDTHLKILSKIAVSLMEDTFIDGLLTAENKEKIFQIISNIE